MARRYSTIAQEAAVIGARTSTSESEYEQKSIRCFPLLPLRYTLGAFWKYMRTTGLSLLSVPEFMTSALMAAARFARGSASCFERSSLVWGLAPVR